MKPITYVACLLIICLIACTGNKSDVLTYKLSRADYTETITIPGTVQAVTSTPVMAPRSSIGGSMTVVRLARDGAVVKKGDTICVLETDALESAYRDQLTSLEKLEAELKSAEADNRFNIALLESQAATSEAQAKISALDSLQMKFATEAGRKLLELEMKRLLIEKQKAEKKLEAARKIAETGIRQMKVRIEQEKARASNYLNEFNSLTLIAQRDGIVQRVEAPKVMVMSSAGSGSFGGPVKEGSVLMSFFGGSPVLQFPDLSQMQISASATESDFKKIERGQKVLITVDAAGKLLTTGKVNRKSLAQSMAQRYSRSKVKSYEIIIDIDSCYSKIKPGLSADCEIILSEVDDTLFVPSIAVFEKDSNRVVYVKRAKTYIPVDVETGNSGSSFTIITGGLNGDETIALAEPPYSLISHKKLRKDIVKNYRLK